VRIVEISPETGREITRHGSVGFRVLGLVRTDQVAATLLALAPHGEIGRHPATVPQRMIVIAGSGAVCGADEVWQNVHIGQMIEWEAGEEHTTRAGDDGLTAIGIEVEVNGSGGAAGRPRRPRPASA
jgi:quercetin dioxygenase-like cupin family protein